MMSGNFAGHKWLRWFPWLGIVAFALAFGVYVAEKSPALARPLSTVRATPNDSSEEWVAVAYAGKRIGWTHTKRFPEGAGLRIEEVMRLKMTLMGQPRDVATQQHLRLDSSGRLDWFEFSMASGPTTIRVTGEQRAAKLLLTLYSAGTTQTIEYSLEQPLVMSGSLPLELARSGLRVGQTFTKQYFDPSIMRPSLMRIAVEGQETWKVGSTLVEIYRLRQTFNGIESTTWVDAKGTVYKEESPTGFTSYRTTEEDAKRLGDGPALDLIAATSIQAENMPASARALRRLTLVLTGVDLHGFDLHGDGQILVGNRLTIDRVTAAKTVLDPSLYLRPEPLLQIQDPVLRAATAEATGGVREPQAASRRLLEWVYTKLEKTSTVSLPSATEVLRTRAGDCNEHAVLYTAMARAAGIPARIASGLVALGDRFYYHAWTEIYLDGAWLAVDPVFGQYPADATHVRFVIGGLDRQAELMRVIGRLKLRVVEVGE